MSGRQHGRIHAGIILEKGAFVCLPLSSSGYTVQSPVLFDKDCQLHSLLHFLEHGSWQTGVKVIVKQIP